MTTDPPANNLILACHITGVYDVNRRETLPDDAYSLVRDWAESISELKLHGLLFHNNLSEKTCAEYSNQYVRYVRINHDPRYKPNVFRYFVYQAFMHQNAERINAIFLTDVSDVVAVRDPFADALFTVNPDTLFCGDEPSLLRSEWMLAHAAHLRGQIADYAAYEKAFAGHTLLNCGIIGGHLPVMRSFIDQLCVIHQQFNADNKTAYTGDMGAFNYLARTRFNDQLQHGAPVNTVFKAYQTDRTDCWFRHK
jgi:hypothetical protein